MPKQDIDASTDIKEVFSSTETLHFQAAANKYFSIIFKTLMLSGFPSNML